MTKKTSVIKFLSSENYPALLLIIFIGLFLRLYQLGTDSLWFDEIGVALVLNAPNPIAMTADIQSHVMAMPLDYWVGWIANRFCHTEACLRLPSALWGTMTLVVSYAYFRQLAGSGIARLSTLFLALMPIAIYYSQELRFYAALIFFYTFSSALLLRALEKPKRMHWIQFIIVTILGSYFHLYVMLVFINGLLLILYMRSKSSQNWQKLIHFFASWILIVVCLLPGYVIFHSKQSFDMFSMPEAFFSILIGLGWFPNWLTRTPSAYLWYFLCFASQIGGIILAFRDHNRKFLFLIISCLTQILFIFGLNTIFGYAFRGRQILFLLPILCALMAYFWIECYKKFLLWIKSTSQHVARYQALFLAFLVVIFFTSNLISLRDYYSSEKSNRRELSEIAATCWEFGDPVWITPAWETSFSEYYFIQLGHREMIPFLVGIDEINAAATQNLVLPRCWITPKNLDIEQRTFITSMDLKIQNLDTENVAEAQLLWCR